MGEINSENARLGPGRFPVADSEVVGMDHKDCPTIFPSQGKVTYGERCTILGQKGVVVWFTGLSGAGKTTISEEIEMRLNRNNRAVYRLDGDNVRFGINADLGFSIKDRAENIRRVAHIASMFRDAGIIVLCAFVSPTNKMRATAREIVGGQHFIEVYVEADLQTCAKRDPKGLYRGNVPVLTGVSSPYEVPESPDIILNTAVLSVNECVDLVIQRIIQAVNEPPANEDPQKTNDDDQ